MVYAPYFLLIMAVEFFRSPPSSSSLPLLPSLSLLYPLTFLWFPPPPLSFIPLPTSSLLSLVYSFLPLPSFVPSLPTPSFTRPLLPPPPFLDSSPFLVPFSLSLLSFLYACSLASSSPSSSFPSLDPFPSSSPPPVLLVLPPPPPPAARASPA